MPDVIIGNETEEESFVGRQLRRRSRAFGDPEEGQANLQAAMFADAITADPNTMSEEDKLGLMGSVMEAMGENVDGVGYFTDNPQGTSGDEMMRMFQNQINPGMHPDVLSGFDKFNALPDEKKADHVPRWSMANAMPRLEFAVGSFLDGTALSFDDSATVKAARKEAEKSFIDKETIAGHASDLKKDDFMAMRSFYEANIQTGLAKQVVDIYKETSRVDESLMMMLPPSDRALVAGYISVIKPVSEDGVLTEAGIRFLNGTKDITLGSLEYVGQKGMQATLAGAELAGMREAGAQLKNFNDILNVEYNQGIANAKKFEERGLVGQATVGFAASLPLMVSLMVPGAGAGKVGKTSELLKIARISKNAARVLNMTNKALRRYPAGMATVSMAKNMEEMLVGTGAYEREEAAPMALATAAVNMYIEKAALDKVLGVGKEKLFAAGQGFLLEHVGNFAYRGTKATAIESLEEAIQNFNETLVTQYGTDRPDLQELLRNASEAYVQAMPTSMAFGGIGGLTGIVTDYKSTISNMESAATKNAVFQDKYEQLFGIDKATEPEKLAARGKLFEGWLGAEDKEEYLSQQSVVDVESANEIFEQDAERLADILEAEQEVSTERLTRKKVMLKDIENARKEAGTVVEAAGLELDFVDVVTGADGPKIVGSLKDGRVVEIRSDYIDPVEIARHEVAHKFIDDMGVLTEQEHATLVKKVGEIEAELKKAGFDVSIYDTKSQSAKAKEIIADAYAILNPQERTIVQKAVDTIKRVISAIQGKGFSSMRSILKAAEKRGIRAVEGRSAEAPAKARFSSNIESTGDIKTGLEVYRGGDVNVAEESEGLRHFTDNAESAFVEGSKVTTKANIKMENPFVISHASQHLDSIKEIIQNPSEQVLDWYGFVEKNSPDAGFNWDNMPELVDAVKQLGFDGVHADLESGLNESHYITFSDSNTTIDSALQEDSIEFAERNVDDFMSLAEAGAARVLQGTKLTADYVEKLMGTDARFRPQDVVNEANAIAGEFGVKGEIKENVSRLDIAKKAEQRRVELLIKQGIREGVRRGRFAEKAESAAKERVKAERTAESKKQQKAARVAPKAYLDNATNNIDVAEAVRTGDMDEMLKDVADAAFGYAEDNGITDKKARESIYKHTLYHALWIGAANKLRWDRSKAVVKGVIDKITDDGTSVEAANKLAAKAIDKLAKIEELSELKGLRKEFGAILSDPENKRATSRTLIKDQKISRQKAAELSIINKLWRKGTKKLEQLSSKIDHAINYEPSEIALKTVEEFQQETLDNIAKELPGLKDPIYRDVDTQKMLMLANVLVRDYGGLYNAGADAIAEAAVALDAELSEDIESVSEVALREQEKVNKNRERMMLSTESAKPGVKSAFSGGAIFGSIQSRLRDFTRIATDQGKAAMEEVINDLDYQEASNEFDHKKRRMAKEWQDQFREAYGLKEGVSGFLPMQNAIIQMGDKKKKWSKFHPKGEDMSKGQIMQLVAVYWQGNYMKQLANSGITEEMVESMEAELTPEDIDFMGRMIKLYSSWGLEIDEVSISLWGTPLSNQSDMYLPVVTDVDKSYNATEVRSIPLMPGSFNKRNPGKDTRIDLDTSFFEVLDGKINENAHWVSHAESSALARSVFNSTKLTRQMIENYGQEAVDFLFEHLNDVYSNQRVEGVKDPLIRRLSAAVSFRYLSGSLKQIFTQPTSFFAFAHTYGLIKGSKMFLEGFADTQTYMDSMSKLWKSDQMQSRIALGQTEFIESAMKQRFGQGWLDAMVKPENARIAAKILSSSIKQAYKFGMVTNTIGDIIPILAVGPTIYMEELSRNNGNEKLAMNKTWDSIEASQQSHATKDRSRLARRGGLAAQLVGQFVNTPGQYAAFEVAAYKQLVDDIRIHGVEGALKRESTKKLLNAITINHVLLPGLFFTVATAFNNFLGDDDWEDEDSIGLGISMLAGPSSAHMVGMALTESFLYAAATGKARWGGGLIPMDVFIKDAKAMGVILNHMKNLDVDQAFEDAVELTPEFVAPVRQVKKAIESR